MKYCQRKKGTSGLLLSEYWKSNTIHFLKCNISVKTCELRQHTSMNGFVCSDLLYIHPQDDEWLSGFAKEPLCIVLSNNHNFHLTGKWYDEKCSETGYGFICQKPQGEILSVFSLSLLVLLGHYLSLIVFSTSFFLFLLSDYSSFLMLNGLSFLSPLTSLILSATHKQHFEV